MSYTIKPGDIFGRVGSGLGSGLAEQLPQEVERFRLKKGLEELSNQKNLSPFQQFSKLASIPGTTNQIIQSGGDLLRQQARANALNNEPIINPFPEPKEAPPEKGSNIPSLTKPDVFEKSLEGYIPPTQNEIFEAAGKRFRENPALYANDPNKAIEAEEKDVSRKEAIAEAYQAKHENLNRIQKNVVDRLKDYSDRLNAQKVPANIFSRIEDKAINATLPKNQGGEGLTEQQAMKKYGAELDEISRQYSVIDSLGNWAVTGRPARATLSSLKDLQRDFEKREDTRNLGDLLNSKMKLSPKLAYAIAEPVQRDPQLNQAIKKLPRISDTRSEDPKYETELIAPKLASLLGKKGSPLAVTYELGKKGYDEQAWIDYLVNNAESLNLEPAQKEQLRKPNPIAGTLNDWWLSSWSGLDNQKE